MLRVLVGDAGAVLALALALALVVVAVLLLVLFVIEEGPKASNHFADKVATSAAPVSGGE